MAARLSQKFDEYRQSGKKSEIYSDFLHTFLPHPNTGQITRKTNVEAAKMALRNLILTNKYERLRNPEFGGNIRRFLFEPFLPQTGPEMEEEIRSMVENYEPRIKLLDVNAIPSEDTNSIDITISFYVITSQEKQEIDITLYRVR